MRATWNNKVVAASEQTIEVGGYHYFPREAVQMSMLREAPRTSRDLECPHGVQFYDIVYGALTGERLAWSYQAPGPTMKHVERWIGFWRDVTVEP